MSPSAPAPHRRPGPWQSLRHHRWLWGLLAASVALAAWSWRLPRQAEPGAAATASVARADGTGPQPAAAASAAVPARPQRLEAARHDPFTGLPAAPARVPPRPAPAPAAAMPEPNALPPAPPDYRYLGRLVRPDGGQVTLLMRGERALAVEQGQQLEDGYLVEWVAPDAIHLRLPASGHLVRIAVPPPAAEAPSAPMRLR